MSSSSSVACVPWFRLRFGGIDSSVWASISDVSIAPGGSRFR